MYLDPQLNQPKGTLRLPGKTMQQLRFLLPKSWLDGMQGCDATFCNISTLPGLLHSSFPCSTNPPAGAAGAAELSGDCNGSMTEPEACRAPNLQTYAGNACCSPSVKEPESDIADFFKDSPLEFNACFQRPFAHLSPSPARLFIQ